MSSAKPSWTGLTRSLGNAALDLLRAEAVELNRDFAAAGRLLRSGSIFLGVAGAIVFWGVGVLTLALVEGLAQVVPKWAAALVVGLGFLLIGLVLVTVGRKRLRKIEGPGALVQRRLENHLSWWSETIVDHADDADDTSGVRVGKSTDEP